MWSRRVIVVGGIGGLASVLLRPMSAAAQAASEPDLRGKAALVTGSTSGLGREVALRLGALGANVIVHGRDSERGAELVSQLNAAGPGRAVFYRADLAALGEVRTLARTVLENNERLDLLINNAGIGGGSQTTRSTSADGHELTFAINYLSHFLLTRMLLPLIERSAPARIVNVSSAGQAAIDFDDVMLERSWSATRAYSQSKLAQIMFTMTLAEQLDAARVIVNSLHPATFMDTGMLRAAGRQPMATVDEGADAVMQLAVAPALAGRTGLYFNGLQEARANAQAYDADARRRLWDLSVELTRE